MMENELKGNKVKKFRLGFSSFILVPFFTFVYLCCSCISISFTLFNIFSFLRYTLESPASLAEHVAHPLGVGKVMGSMLGPNWVIVKNIKSVTYCCYVRFATLLVSVGGMSGP